MGSNENRPIRELSDRELEERWNDRGDALARDVLALRRWRGGDRDAGMELLDNYGNYFYQICVRFGVKRDDEIEEVFQEVVLDLAERIGHLPEQIEKSFAGFYCWRIRNAILRHRKKTSAEGVTLEDAGTTMDPQSLEAWEGIELCWKRLPPREYRVFELRFLQEMSLKEVAAELDSNVNAVGQAIFRLSRKMKDCLSRSGFSG